MDGMDDLLDQLMKALDFQDPKLRKKLREGLEQGFEQVDVTKELHFSFDLDGNASVEEATPRPEVTVLDGGRTEAEPRRGERPDLEVVPDADGDPADEQEEDSEPQVSVRVVRAGPRRLARLVEGSIDVDGDQTVFRGLGPCPYRLHCDQGAFRAVADGVPIETIQAGQSLDVEATCIQVRGRGRGRFTRAR